MSTVWVKATTSKTAMPLPGGQEAAVLSERRFAECCTVLGVTKQSCYQPDKVEQHLSKRETILNMAFFASNC